MLDAGTQLSIMRTRLAADRTLMAWIRTSFAMITFGFGVAKFFQYLHEQQQRTSFLEAPRNLGLILVSVGTLSLLAGAYEYWHALRRLREMGSVQRAPTAIGVIAILVGIFGVLALVGIGVEVFQGTGSERTGCLDLLRRARKEFQFQPSSFGGDKGFFESQFIEGLLTEGIEPHIAVDERWNGEAHQIVRRRRFGEAYRLSQRCRKKIEELFGEGKDWHGLRRLRRRGLKRVREEVHLIGWVLNLKRLAKSLALVPSTG